ncbi:G-protein coupled receptor 37-like 1, partial [Boleophthalmus pectinirostris]|uniref:G-protein coupled receptor 37-like 1 n=1 Tax=Boleophthalmus pectinirostris TaxID=150288 RepID=UPI00242F8453
MSACWTLVVLLLCARGHRAEDPRQDPGQDPRQDPRQDPERDALEVRRAGTLTRGARRGAPSAGFSPERVREDAARPEEMEPSHRGDTRVSPPGDTRVSPPGDRGSVSPGDRRRFPRGTKGAGRRRDRTRSTLDPDRFFTTPRTAPPPVNASVRAALLPLGAGARWAYAVLLLALVLFSVGLVGNLALMCLVWHSLHLKSAWNCVLAGLALWDFLVLFFCVPVLLLHQLTGARLALSCSLVPFLEVS